MKKLLSLFAATLMAASMFAASEVLYTLDTSLKANAGTNNSYAATGDVTVNGVTWNAMGNLTMQPWRIGGKSITDAERVVKTTTAYETPLEKVVLTLGTATGITGTVSFTYSTDKDFNGATATTPVAIEANKVYTFAPEGGIPANSFVKFTFIVTVSDTKNKFVEFSKVEFYGNASAGPDGSSVEKALTITPEVATATAEDKFYKFTTLSAGKVHFAATATKQVEYDFYTEAGTATGEELMLSSLKGYEADWNCPAAGTYYILENQGGDVTLTLSGDAFKEKLPVYTCAAANKLADGAKGQLGACTVVYANGAYNYVQDETGMTLVYAFDLNLKAGSQIAAGMEFVMSIYNNLPELKPVASTIVATDGEAPAIADATEAPSKENINLVVWYTGVTAEEDGAFKADSKNTLNLEWDDNTIAFYNTFKIAAEIEVGKTYKILGANAIYKENLQVYPLAVEEVVEEVAAAATFEDIEIAANSTNKALINELYDDEENEEDAILWMSGDYVFTTYVDDYGTKYYYDFLVSSHTDKEFDSKKPDYDLHAAAGCAAEGNNYAVWYDNWYGSAPVYLAMPSVISGLAITNTSWTVDAILKGDGMSTEADGKQGLPMAQGDYYAVKISGMVFDDEEGDYVLNEKNVTFYLADFRTEGDWKYAAAWQWVDLTSLGKVDAITFSVSGTKANSYGLTTPKYFCIDNVGGKAEDCTLGEMTKVTPTPTGMSNTGIQNEVRKTVENGELIIRRDGVRYNVLGISK